MSRIAPVNPDTATGKVKTLLDAVKAQLGITPNLMRTLGQSPAALEGYLSLMGALAKGELKGSVREQLALEVAQLNNCNYCLSAHAFLGKMQGLSPAAILAARHGTATDPHTHAALTLAARITESRGHVSNEDLQSARAAGITDGQLAEVVAHVALNVLTNYFNSLAQTEIDFPVAEALAA
jgi:uncharacterized peroxidase-related enzyme